MALQTSGQISLNDIHVEAGGSSGSQAGINDSDIRGLISKGSGSQMTFAEWYGAANAFAFTISSNQTNASLSSLATSAGWDGSQALDVTVNSGVWLYATSTSYYGLTIDVANTTLKNYGKIIGQGGYGGSGTGGAALRITQSGCTVNNYSGAYIAGGGGGGGGDWFWRGGGGGAGGGGGQTNSQGRGGGGGGGLNGSGGNGALETTTNDGGVGGGAGGSGSHFGGGGGGGRILPGTGGAAHTLSYGGYYGTRGAGGSGGSAGGNGSSNSNGSSMGGGSGGGGGWGANGGNASYGGGGGSGGAAISKTTSYTLSNSGTIYGST